MNSDEIKIAKLLDEILLNNDFIKNLSKSGISDFIKIGDTKFIRLFQYDLKLGVDYLSSKSNDTNQSNDTSSILKTYLFNDRGYLESSYKLDIEVEYSNNNTIKDYTKKGPDLESGSELEEIRNIALYHSKKYKEENERLMLEWEHKNKGIAGFFRRIFKLNSCPLELDEPSEEYFKLKELINTIINKQLSFINV